MMVFPQKEAFVSWLDTKDPSELVGKACSLGDCPLATFLRARGAPDPYVRPDRNFKDSCWRPHHGKRGPLPEWANDFALTIDEFGERAVAAADAKEIMAILHTNTHKVRYGVK
jgi:hypothetical protein